jgi:hypothetical protein
MYKSAIALALCLTMTGCAAPQTNGVQASTPKSSSAKTKSGDRVCETIQEEDTGTRLGSRKVCRDANPQPAGNTPT